MAHTVKEIARLVEGELVGNGDAVVNGPAGIEEAGEGDLTFVANPRYFGLIQTTRAAAVICPRDMEAAGRTLIRSDNPSWAFSRAMSLFLPPAAKPLPGIHPTAVIAGDAALGKEVSIGPYVVIESKAAIGDRTIIGSGCFIGAGTAIGADCRIYPNVTIRERTSIGRRVIIHSGAVVGADGFGYVNLNGVQEKIPQLGTVEIQDDVEIGANVTIDRARFDKTVIGAGTKIDNLVQIAHNVRIGKNCTIVAQAGIAGSTVLEDNVTLAGQAGIVGHLTIGAGAIIAAQAGVINSVEPNTVVSGYPAKPHAVAKRVNACVQRLPHYVEVINELNRRVEELGRKTQATTTQEKAIE